ncbi:hypothetical protein [Frigoriglobus tundricola]|uniref:SHOCT domain-containing protein n=1 Tax=Frigoriglobus tundricola TaxID=2774151 RepID=A0A6M5YK91_9BACT|nr:hypothetical protein [Frigoriglobus tundricola]QJW94447.1 hypothetical protein FTUN_1967 [Frigoriglobus tundricola]
MWSLFLFAQTREDPLRRPEVVWGVIGLTVALLAGAAVIYAVDRWRKRAMAAVTDTDEAGSLTSFRDMFESGEITEAEYAELRRRVAEKVKKKPAAAVAETKLLPPAPSRPASSPPQGASNVAPVTDSSPPPAPPGAPGVPPEPPPPPSSA